MDIFVWVFLFFLIVGVMVPGCVLNTQEPEIRRIMICQYGKMHAARNPFALNPPSFFSLTKPVQLPAFPLPDRSVVSS